MLESIKNIFGFGPKIDYRSLLQNGAIILDVRSPREYAAGHIEGSKNIPLHTLPQHLSTLKKEQTIITCCASGIRSASAKNILKSNGFSEVHNGGGWHGLKSKID